MQCARALLYCHLWPVWLYHIFPHYLKNGTDFRRKYKVTAHKMCVFILSTTFVWNMSHFKRKRARYDQKCILAFMQFTVILVRLRRNLNTLYRFSQNTQISNLIKKSVQGEVGSWKQFHSQITFRKTLFSSFLPWRLIDWSIDCLIALIYLLISRLFIYLFTGSRNASV